jgi:outer membrane protein assembly factor BamB
VVNGKVYVGCGEGEFNAWGFVYCLDAASGKVLWLFCTNQFFTGVDNPPCAIPASAAGFNPLPPGFFTCPDPPQRGASVWSSCAYDATLNAIFVGTGNTAAADNMPLPDFKYGSGVLALDADTGAFRGFYGQVLADSYRPGDNDADVASSPTLFGVAGQRRVGVGSKNGSFFLLDGATMVPVQKRQLLPTDANTGAALPNVDPIGTAGENKWGVFGTAAVQGDLNRLFVGLGGYEGIGDAASTPFIRVMDVRTLDDAWPTDIEAVGGNEVVKYLAPRPPLYTTQEAGLSSPTVVNDVVFVSTSLPALYAMNATTGALLWTAPGLGAVPGETFVLGPAVYGRHVVIGAGNTVYIYGPG